MNKSYKPIVATALIALLVSAALGRPSDEGAVAGKVTSKITGQPLAGALVTVAGTSLSSKTDDTGAYRIGQLHVGEVEVEVEYLGYDSASGRVIVTEGKTSIWNATLETSIRESETVVDEPILESQAAALNRQRNSLTIINVVAADQIGRFPDPNTAEAAQRIPGVTLQRDQGDGRYVSIRGTEPRLNSMAINGERLPSPDGEVRQVALDVIPADLLQAIVVTKLLTADQDADAIGGNLNLLTKQAPETLRLSGTFGLGYVDLTGSGIQTGNVTFGDRYFENKLGLVATGSFFNSNRGSDNFEAEYDDGELESFEIRDYTFNRKRNGGTTRFDFDLSDRTEFVFDAIYNDYRDDELRRRLTNGVSDNELVRSLRDREEIQKIATFAFGAVHRFANELAVDGRFHFGYAEEDGPNRQTTDFLQEDVEFAPNVAPGSIDPDDIRANPLNEDVDAYVLDSVLRSDTFTSDRDLNVSGNVALPALLHGDFGALFRFGGKFTRKVKYRNDDSIEYGPEDDIALAPYLGAFDPGNFLRGRYSIGPFVDPTQARGLLSQGEFEAEFDHEEDAGDFRATENISAFYGLAQLFSGTRFSLVPGLRYERTNIDYEGYSVLFDEDGDYVSTTPVPGANDFDALLPSVAARFAFGENTVVRTGVARSLSRPNYYDLVPYQVVNEEDEEILQGNPGLVQTTAVNFDLLAEHYFESVGVVSGGFFYKNIDGFIFPSHLDEVRDGTEFDVIQPRNGDEADLFGFEFAFQNNFRGLPSPLDGLGVILNYTYTDSEARVPAEDGLFRTLALPGQNKHVGNASVIYEKYGFSGALSWNYHSRYLEEVGEDVVTDFFVDEHLQLDLALAQRVHRNIRVFAQFVNLTNEPFRRFQGSPDRPVQEEYYSWWATFGVKFDF